MYTWRPKKRCWFYAYPRRFFTGLRILHGCQSDARPNKADRIQYNSYDFIPKVSKAVILIVLLPTTSFGTNNLMAAELICIEAELDVIEMIEMIRKSLVCVSYTKIGMNQDIKCQHALRDTPPNLLRYCHYF